MFYLITFVFTFLFLCSFFFFFFFSSRRRHTRYIGDWSSDVCSSDLLLERRIQRLIPKKRKLSMLRWRRGLCSTTRTSTLRCTRLLSISGASTMVVELQLRKGERRMGGMGASKLPAGASKT